MRRAAKPIAPYQPDQYFIGSTETAHAIVDCYEVSKGRIVLLWKSKYDDVVHEEAFWRPAHATPEVAKALVMEKLHAIDNQAKEFGGGQGDASALRGVCCRWVRFPSPPPIDKGAER